MVINAEGRLDPNHVDVDDTTPVRRLERWAGGLHAARRKW